MDMSRPQRPGHDSPGHALIRWIALALGAAGLITYAVLRIEEGRPALPNIIGAALGIVVLALLGRRR